MPRSPFSLSTRRAPDGWTEIGIRVGGELIAVVTRACVNAEWFVHRAGAMGARGERFRSRKSALASLGVVN